MAERSFAGVQEVVIWCPRCGNWTMRASCEGRIEVNCKGRRCGATLEVEIHNNRPVIKILAVKKAQGPA